MPRKAEPSTVVAGPDVHMTPAATVIAKLAEQASAQEQIARLHRAGLFPQFADDHAETARLFTLLHAACVTDGLLDRLQEQVPAC